MFTLLENVTLSLSSKGMAKNKNYSKGHLHIEEWERFTFLGAAVISMGIRPSFSKYIGKGVTFLKIQIKGPKRPKDDLISQKNPIILICALNDN